MTGKPGARAGTCALCGGATAEGVATIPFISDDRVFTVKEVPAEICQDCGEAYMAGAVVDRVQKMIEELRALEAEISVTRYHAA